MAETQPVQAKESVATIFGAPISWVALYAALVGATSLIPLIFYAEGGGYTALSSPLGLFAGLVLGPIPGFIATLAGSIIILMLNPAAMSVGPIGLVNPSIQPLFAGLVVNKKWYYATGAGIVAQIVGFQIVPWIFPGPIAGYATHDPVAMFMATWVYWGGVVVGLITFPTIVPKWIMSNDPKKLFVCNLCLMWGVFDGIGGTWWANNLIFGTPPGLVIFITTYLVPWQRLIAYPAAAIIGSSLIIALRKAKLRKIPGSII
jgi:hypothetical protein